MGARTAQSKPTPRSTFAEICRIFKSIAPVVAGLALSNICFNVTDNDDSLHLTRLFAENTTIFAAIVVLAVLMLILSRTKKPLSERKARAIALRCIVLQCTSAVALGIIEMVGGDTYLARTIAGSIMSISATVALLYWLRCAKGSSSIVATVLTFTAVIISIPTIFLCSYLPHDIAYALLAAMGIAQFYCVHLVSRHPLPCTIQTTQKSIGYFTIAKTMADNKRFLIMTSLGLWLIASAKALIHALPSGFPMPYTSVTLFIYLTTTLIISIVLLFRSFDETKNTMTVDIWLILQGLAALALLLCAFLPDNLDVGLSFTYVLDVLVAAYTWYVSIAFISYGRFDPFYYAAGGTIAFLLPKTAMNVLMPFFMSGIPQTTAITAAAGVLILVCAQLVFLEFPRAAIAPVNEEGETTHNHAAWRAFGIDEHIDSSIAMQTAIMRRNTSIMAESFMLSARETEVLTYYALGHTQEKIAKELWLSPGTVHTYVKRIHQKTDLHSRQNVLDYLERYTK
jgi:DNA-binding CsgD family transcriptional regulator/multidrug transporter EmrE-like cation transporter